MIFARFYCSPAPKHPGYSFLGDGYANCWIQVRSFHEAEVIAKRNIRSQHWKVLELEEIWRIPKGHYQIEAGGLEFYEQALIDKAVFCFHTCPKFPVLCLDFEVVATKQNLRYDYLTPSSVKYFVSRAAFSETISEMDDFWSHKSNLTKAALLGRKFFRTNQWRVITIGEVRPVNHKSKFNDPEFPQYYEEAEEFGECAVFYTDSSPKIQK